MTDTATLRARNADFWAQTSPGWVHQADRHDEIGRPLGAVALDQLQPQPGERVLDVGCGCGGTTAEIARAVGPSGNAVGLDLAEAMVATARSRFSVPGAAGPQFVTGDIETLGAVPGAPFDAVYARMTLMLLADPVAGLTTIRRSMRSGGRMAATVFRDGGANPGCRARCSVRRHICDRCRRCRSATTPAPSHSPTRPAQPGFSPPPASPASTSTRTT
ncbi:class I SAM-dependent methyltransferase [Paractinoplanes durhamensis]|uniref:class I SAM-dependent methyltransferase n=1 Tax=Paractinoplanes durhamensis TaxID=113563 RepID=UPI0036435EB5